MPCKILIDYPQTCCHLVYCSLLLVNLIKYTLFLTIINSIHTSSKTLQLRLKSIYFSPNVTALRKCTYNAMYTPGKISNKRSINPINIQPRFQTSYVILIRPCHNFLSLKAPDIFPTVQLYVMIYRVHDCT